MSYDQTVETLTGARILKCTRVGSCLDLETDKGRVIVGAIKEHEAKACYGCGETRLVREIVTGTRREASCDVCGHFWKLG